MFSPACRAECLALRDCLERYAFEISSFCVHSVAPPSLDTIEANSAIFRVLKSEIDDDHTNRVTGIQCGR